MKRRSWLLTLVTAISAFALLGSPAEAGGNKKHHRHGWNGGYTTYYQRSYRPYRYSGPYGYYRPYGYNRPDYSPPYYGPVYYGPSFGVQVEFR